MDKQYLDYEGLVQYDGKIKTHIHNEDLKRVDIKDIITTQDIDNICK